MMDIFRSNLAVFGWRYCGAYIKNDARKNGLKDRFDVERVNLVSQMQ